MGGADKVSTFVSLLGANQLNVAVLMDANPKDQQRIKSLQDNGHLSGQSLIQISEFTKKKEADIEDLFDPEFYCTLVSGAYASELPSGLKLADLTSKVPRITARVEQQFKAISVANGRLNHYRPAVHLLREQHSLLTHMSDDATLKRAASMFDRINSRLK